jgi:ATP-dependent Zn protease
MDDNIGLMSHLSEKLLDAAAPEITSRIKIILDEELDKAKKLISENRAKFDKLVNALLDKEKLTQEEIASILD